MKGERGFPVRIAFTKTGKVRFISHRDVARAFERAFRIESLPLLFTQGFSPRPKVSFGLALSVGHESDADVVITPAMALIMPGVVAGARIVGTVHEPEIEPELEPSAFDASTSDWMFDSELPLGPSGACADPRDRSA